MRDWFKLFIIEFKELLLTPSNYLPTIFFYIAAVSLIPLTLGVEPNQLSIVSSAIIWVLFLLVVLLVAQNLFLVDFQTGVIEQIIITDKSISLWVLVKVLVYWLVIGLPLMLISPLLALSLYFDSKHLADFYLVVFLTAPILFFLAAIAASFTVALRGNFIILAMMSFPLCIPVLILSSSSLALLVNGLDASGLIKLLVAALLLTSAFCPLVSGKILRVLFQ